MIIDTHAHIYTRDSDRYPIIDKPYAPPAGSGSPEGLIAEMDAAGVDKVMMVQTTTYYGWDNSYMRDTVPQYSDRARGVFTLDPEHPHSADLIYSLVDRAGMTALRTYPVRQGDYDHPGNRALWAACRETGTTINALIGEARYAAELAAIMTDYPEVPVTLDHAIHLDIAAPEYNDKLSATLGLADCPNMNAKLSFLATGSAEEYPFTDMHPATRQIIDAYGPERCVWGSDYPLDLWAPKTTYSGYLQLFQNDLGLSEGEKDAILGGSADRLYFSR